MIEIISSSARAMVGAVHTIKDISRNPVFGYTTKRTADRAIKISLLAPGLITALLTCAGVAVSFRSKKPERIYPTENHNRDKRGHGGFRQFE